MLPDISIGLGIIGIVIGIIGLLRIYFKSVTNSKKFFTFFLIIGLLVLPIGVVIKYVSRGNDALTSTDIDGRTAGDEKIEYQQGQINSTMGQYVDTNGNSYSYVSIRENTISFNGQMIGGVEEFEEYVKKLDSRLDIILEDDFAVSVTYYKVEELLNDYGLKIIRKE